MKTHKDLEVWKLSISFVTEIYKITKTFPKDELYGLTSQIRRASVSIPSNIAEGAARKGNKEIIQFLYIALASASEVETQLIIANNLNYIESPEYDEYSNTISRICRMLSSLIKSISSKQ